VLDAGAADHVAVAGKLDHPHGLDHSAGGPVLR
jgi:hypothetical protein